MELKIGALAITTGVSAPAIRYYEQIGLLPPAARQGGSQRVYGPGDVRRLTFIRRCREFGFGIEQTRDLIALGQDHERSCREVRDLGQARLRDIRQKLDELRELERSVAAFVQRCETVCAGNGGAECEVLENLSSASGGCSGNVDVTTQPTPGGCASPGVARPR